MDALGREIRAAESLKREIIRELKAIRDAIVEEDKNEQIGKIAYSSGGIVGGGLAIAGLVLAPITFGTSLALTIAGSAVGVASGSAAAIHFSVKKKIVKEKIEEADRLIERYRSKLEDIYKMVQNLTRYGRYDGDDIWQQLAKMGGVGSSIKSVVTNALKLGASGGYAAESVFSVVSSVSRGFMIAGGVFSAIFILKDLGSIISNSVDLHNGKISECARQLNDIIYELERN